MVLKQKADNQVETSGGEKSMNNYDRYQFYVSECKCMLRAFTQLVRDADNDLRNLKLDVAVNDRDINVFKSIARLIDDAYCKSSDIVEAHLDPTEESK